MNEISITNAATGGAPAITATGDDTNIGLAITPKGTGALVLDGLSWPTADGTNGQVLQTNGSGALSFGASAGGGFIYVGNISVTSGSTIALTNLETDTHYRMIITYTGVTAGADIIAEISTSNGAPYLTTLYARHLVFGNQVDAGITNRSSSTSTDYFIFADSVADEGYMILDFYTGDATRPFRSLSFYGGTDIGNTNSAVGLAHNTRAAAVYNAFRFYPLVGTWTVHGKLYRMANS